jgi:hypothetical protein
VKIKDIAIPEIYKSSADFRFFINWFQTSLEKIQYDTENLVDLYDPLRCPNELLWCLADTMGYKYDNRLPTSFNRLVLLNFMSMIYNRGSRNGMILAAETNLAQFRVLEDGKRDDIYYNRLEDTSIPTNAVSVISHVPEGYVDVVYFSTEMPKDACIEYVRPIGMFCFQHVGVEFNSITTKISIDVRLTNLSDMHMSFGPTQVGHYRRADYASLQSISRDTVTEELEYAPRHKVWDRNSAYEGNPSNYPNPGYRALYSLQLANNDNIVESLLPPIFTLGYRPMELGADMVFPDDYYKHPSTDEKMYNLRYDITTDQEHTTKTDGVDYDVYTIDIERSPNPTQEGRPTPMPAINPIMMKVGDGIPLDPGNIEYLGGTLPTNENDYIYFVHPEDSETVKYIGRKLNIKTPLTLEDKPLTKLGYDTYYETDVRNVEVQDGVEIIE